MKHHQISCRILIVLGGFLTIVGLFIMAANDSPLFGIINGLIDPLFWGQETISAGTAQFKRFAWSYMGMLCALWGISVFFITRYALAKGERWAWFCLAGSALAWVCMDSWFSLAAGLYFNLACNLAILLAFGIPLFLTRELARKQHG
jgi:hypothetical protein